MSWSCCGGSAAIVPAAAPTAPRPRASARPQVHVIQPRGRERGSASDGDDGTGSGDAPMPVPAVAAATQPPAAPLHEAGSKVEVPAVTVPIASANATDPFLRAAPATPRTPGGKAAFPYYCPLCMVHYAAVLETTCCRNYVCAPCATDYLLRRAPALLHATAAARAERASRPSVAAPPPPLEVPSATPAPARHRHGDGGSEVGAGVAVVDARHADDTSADGSSSSSSSSPNGGSLRGAPSVPLPTGTRIGVPCPHCAVASFFLALVSVDAKPRSYLDSPATVAALQAVGRGGTGAPTGGSGIYSRGLGGLRSPMPAPAGSPASLASAEGGATGFPVGAAMEPVAEEDGALGLSASGDWPGAWPPPPAGSGPARTPSPRTTTPPLGHHQTEGADLTSPLVPRALAPFLCATPARPADGVDDHVSAPSWHPAATAAVLATDTPVAALFAEAARGGDATGSRHNVTPAPRQALLDFDLLPMSPLPPVPARPARSPGASDMLDTALDPGATVGNHARPANQLPDLPGTTSDTGTGSGGGVLRS